MTDDRREAGRWLDDATDDERMLWRQHNVASRAQLIRSHTDRAIAHRVNSGSWQRAHHSVYVLHNGPTSDRQRLWIATLATGDDSCLAGITAAEEHGFRSLRGRDQPIHVLAPHDDRPRSVPAGVRLHRTRTLQPGDVQSHWEPPRTSIERSIIDAASWARCERDAYAIVTAAYQQRLLAPSALQPLVDRLTRLKHRKTVMRAAADAESGVHSDVEGLLVDGLRDEGLPIPALHFKRRDVSGGLRYLDGYYEEWRLHLEVDGAHHLDQQAYWNDMRRQNELWISGDRVLRFPAVAVRFELEEVLAQIRRALTEAGWRPI